MDLDIIWKVVTGIIGIVVGVVATVKGFYSPRIKRFEEDIESLRTEKKAMAEAHTKEKDSLVQTIKDKDEKIDEVQKDHLDLMDRLLRGGR